MGSSSYLAPNNSEGTYQDCFHFTKKNGSGPTKTNGNIEDFASGNRRRVLSPTQIGLRAGIYGCVPNIPMYLPLGYKHGVDKQQEEPGVNPSKDTEDDSNVSLWE